MRNKKKILFFHFDLEGGGAERVLINLLNNINLDKYDVTLETIFGTGPYVKSIPQGIKFKSIFKFQFRGFSYLMRFLPARFWHWLFVRDKYDIEVAYLENSPTRIISACPCSETKKVAWVHIEFDKRSIPATGFKNEQEMLNAYNRFEHLVFVAHRTQECFEQLFPEITVPKSTIHNVNDFGRIYKMAEEECPINLESSCLNICAVNKLTKVKAFDRLVDACSRLKKDGLMDNVRIYLLGEGDEEDHLRQLIADGGLELNFNLLGFQPNPYKYLSKMDLFICTSHREGYSTATTEAVALGVPVFTTDCSGMNEILEDGRFGMIVPNDDESIYQGLKDLLTHREKIDHYAETIRLAPRKTTQSLVDEYEKFFDSL